MRKVEDCMTVSSKEEGVWEYVSDGREETCGLYLVTDPENIVEVVVEELTVECGKGLVVIFDGWELNGHVFPSEEDHARKIEERSQAICSEGPSRGFAKRAFISSQNAALVSFNIPKKGEGFRVRVKFLKNKDPCNILMSDMAGVFTLASRAGVARNCSLTTLLFPASFTIQSLAVGADGSGSRRFRREGRSILGLKTMCYPDFVQLGGSSELQSSNLATSQTLCGAKDKQELSDPSLTVLCGSSTVRLVSSGLFNNEVSVRVKAAAVEDLNFQQNLVMTCPEFMSAI